MSEILPPQLCPIALPDVEPGAASTTKDVPRLRAVLDALRTGDLRFSRTRDAVDVLQVVSLHAPRRSANMTWIGRGTAAYIGRVLQPAPGRAEAAPPGSLGGLAAHP